MLSRLVLLPYLIGVILYAYIFLHRPVDAQSLFVDMTPKAFEFSKLRLTPDYNTVAVGDYDNDGWPDLFTTEFWGAQMVLLHNQGDGRFIDRSMVIPTDISIQQKGSGALFGDYDRDGDLDLYVPVGRFALWQRASGIAVAPNALLRNDRGIFSNVTQQAGLTRGLATSNTIWLDYNRDGHLDLYLGNMGFEAPGHPNLLYRNRGNGTYEDATQAAGLTVNFAPGFSEGSNGGLAAADFDNNGWPDLYLGVYNGANRLFLNEGGKFSDLTTAEIADESQALGVLVGDIDNDSDLDIFQAVGGSGDLPFKSKMLLNLGKGEFIDVTDGVGLSDLGNVNVQAPSLADFDNDGDLDLLATLSGASNTPPFFFVNDGDGNFTNRSDQSGITHTSWLSAVADYDLDGFLDLVLMCANGNDSKLCLYRNQGNDNHWLQIELAGKESNRYGIGARLAITAGGQRQIREILGGNGWMQEEYIAHFGLGTSTQVEQLEIRWPSGQVDVLTNLPIDQKIRILEGGTDYQVVHPTEWVHNLPETVAAGTALEVAIEVRPALYTSEARIVQVNADLSQLGGSAQTALSPTEEGVYSLATQVAVSGTSGLKDITLTIDQETSLGSHWAQLVHTLKLQPAVLSREDLPIFADELAPGWSIESEGDLEINLQAQSQAIQGTSSLGLQTPISPWAFTFRPDQPIDVGSYETLRFSFLPENVVFDPQRGPPILLLWLNGNYYGRIGLINGPFAPEGVHIEPSLSQWQQVELPLEIFALRGPLESITISAALSRPWIERMSGTFFIDDIRLVAGGGSDTAVAQNRSGQQPQAFALDQNYPNPFNSGTIIPFALPQQQQVEIAIYNIVGQQVATLVEDLRPAGRYSVNWDGRDQAGQLLASGTYLYRLQSGTKVETRKLLLLR